MTVFHGGSKRREHPLDDGAPTRLRSSRTIGRNASAQHPPSGRKNEKPALSLLLVLCFVSAAPAQPLTRDRVPEPLRPWIDWTLHGHEEDRCPFFQGEGDRRQCAWPSRLSLDLGDRGGRFTQEWLAYREEWVALPGDARTWPLDVRIDGAPAAVVARGGGSPAIRLPKGRHAVAGGFAWDAPPPLLQVPAGTGLLRLTLHGRPVPFPARDTEGRVWLEKGAGAGREESRLEITVLRHLLDDVPLVLTTRVDLAVSGESREELLGRALPDGFVPLSISGPLPARLEPDGRLRVQVRAGRFTVAIVARHEGPASAVARPDPGGPWDDQEVWVFEARPDLRLASIEGVPGIDPQQTALPEEWKRFPAYLVKPGESAAIVEKRRGDADPSPDQLTLRRNWWLDFDGRGGTVHDTIDGGMSRGWRLEMQAPAVLGRVAIGGRDQVITRLAEGAPAGVEVRQGMIHLEADGRYEGRVADLPAVGWDRDFREVSGTLNLGPGWRLFHASGVDDVSATWISSWTLLDIFLVLILTLSAARLWGRRAGLLALATLGLAWIEPGAPRWSWVAVLACEAIGRALPEGKIRNAFRLLRAAALVILILVAVPFMVGQVRAAIYPALEEPFAWRATVGAGGIGRGDLGRAEARLEQDSMEAPAAGEVARKEKSVVRGVVSGVVGGALGGVEGSLDVPSPRPHRKADLSNLLVHDPRAVVQTGPGIPSWEWRQVSLRWRGPVERSQRLGLILVPPGVNAALAFLRVGLLLVLGFVVFGTRGAGWRSIAAAGTGRALLALILWAAAPAAARAEFPTNEMLESLRARLLEPPECRPECASSPRLLLEAGPEGLRVRMEVLAAADTAVPLPGGAEEWPERVILDGVPAPGLSRGPGGRLWAPLGPGLHQFVMEGRLPDRDTFEIPLPLRPHQVTARAEGWRVLGVQADGRPEDTLQLVRVRARGRSARSLESGSLPPFVRVERDLTLGLRWQARTRVVRVSPPGTAIVLEVPLLAGESVTTADLRVRDRHAQVGLGPQTGEVIWESSLAETPEISLRAPGTVPWTEVWRMAVGATWHAEVEGIPVVHRPDDGEARLREWRPWPGESVTVRITRPEGVAGRTLTIDGSALGLSPGLRATDATLLIAFRSSRGGQHDVTLPEGSILQSVSINDAVQPIRLEGRRLTLPVAPGAACASIVWREPRGIGAWFRTPAIDLGETSVNTGITVTMPADRWTLFLGGPRLGPAVIFWSFLAVSLIVSFVLGRSRLTPLRWQHWFLLSLGLTQAPLPVALLVALWLFALGARRARGGAARAVWFDLMQIVLAGLTIAALAGLFWSIQRGLLGPPEMQITGNGSHAAMLRWYQDRAGATLPRPWVVSVPLLLYRLAMLAWSMWLAVALLGWIRWGWACFSEGGIWRRVRAARPAPPPIAGGTPAR